MTVEFGCKLCQSNALIDRLKLRVTRGDGGTRLHTPKADTLSRGLRATAEYLEVVDSEMESAIGTTWPKGQGSAYSLDSEREKFEKRPLGGLPCCETLCTISFLADFLEPAARLVVQLWPHKSTHHLVCLQGCL